MKRPLLHRRKTAAAIIFALVFIVLVSCVVTAWFSRVSAHRKLAESSFHQARTEEAARSALDILIGSLRKEVCADIKGPARNVRLENVPALLRVSDAMASDALSTATSANGRAVTAARWNRHYLFPCADLVNFTDTTPTAAFPVPRWVFVTGSGPVVLTAPDRRVLFRYAYALYDEGALLDANVAGYPVAATAQSGPKGSQAWVDLTMLDGITEIGVHKIVGWRHYASVQPQGALSGTFIFDAEAANRYAQLVTSNTNGFLQVTDADQNFVSRQALVDFSHRTRGSAFRPRALRHMGTFIRAVTAPAAFDHIRVSHGGTVRRYHDDGTFSDIEIKAGEPLLSTRFSLARLLWIFPSAEPMETCFGLRWDEGKVRWDYVDAKIKTLEEVAAESAPREPNFFELLKAGTGLEDREVLQLGADLRSQTISTTIALNDVIVTGMPSKNLHWPLRSVGELCHAGLWDLFSTMEEPPVIAGQLHPANASAVVLQSLLVGALKSGTSGEVLTEAEAGTIAIALVARLKDNPLETRADLADAEAPVVRALAPVLNTRTWNFMIDLVAQTGMFPPGAETLDEFFVKGERRYWLHIAIDRITGKVVDAQFEPVFE